ncbi:MAG TPA: PLP-dependent aminotransferase family protein [Candidatus Obscuribacterales bacterium]
MNFVVNLEYQRYVPLYRRLSDALRKAILEGRLKPGDAIPSVRDMATTFRLSRATVLKSLEDLHKQGFLETIHGSGTYVKKRWPGDLSDLLPPRELEASDAQTDRSAQLSAYGRRVTALCQAESKEWNVHLPQINFGGPPLNLTPMREWKALLLKHSKGNDLQELTYIVEPCGYPMLREAIAAYLHRLRAVRARADQVITFSSKQLRLDLIARVLLEPGDCVGFEEPGYSEARVALASHGAEIVPIPVDGDGLNVDYLLALPLKFKLVYVTPSHHDPTGAVLSLERRRQLIAWAKRTGAYIIEDDYDCEYRYGRKPLPSLQGLDGGDCVIYLASLWKIMFQALRFGFIIVPERLRSVCVLAKTQSERYLPVLEQLALSDLINEGHLERHLRKTQGALARHRQALIYALTKHAGGRVRLAPESAGMHVLIEIDTDLSDDAVLRLAYEARVPLISTRAHYMGAPRKGEFVLSFAEIHESTIESCIQRWMELMEEYSAGGRIRTNENRA